MDSLDARRSQAILRLSSNSDFQVFCEWLASSLEKADVANRSLEGAALHRSQGKAVTLEAILRAPEDAQKALVRAAARA